jgi:hypothetical protein
MPCRQAGAFTRCVCARARAARSRDVRLKPIVLDNWDFPLRAASGTITTLKASAVAVAARRALRTEN